MLPAEGPRVLGNLEPRRLSRRQLLGTTLGGVAISLLAACAGGQGSQAPAAQAPGPTAPSGGLQTVTFEGWNYEPPLVEQNLQRFMQRNPDVKVSYTPIETTQYRQKLVAEYTANANPDALYVRDDYFAGWVTAGYLQDLEGLPGVDKVYGMIYDYNADAMTYAGKRYGLPYYADVYAFVYNEEMLQRAGITTPPRSLQELEEQSLKVKQAGVVQYPLSLGLKLTNDFWGHWWALIYASGAKLFSEDMQPIMESGNTVAREVLTWIVRAMTETKIVYPASLELNGDQARDAFIAGQHAYMVLARYDIERSNNPSQSKVAGKVKMALIPSLDGENKGTVGWTRMYCLSANTKVKDAAYKLIYYLGGVDENDDPFTARFWFRERGLGFAYKKLANDPEIKSLLAKWVDPAIYGQQALTARARENIKEPWYSEWESGNQQLMQRALTGQIGVDDVMKGMAESARRLKKQNA